MYNKKINNLKLINFYYFVLVLFKETILKK